MANLKVNQDACFNRSYERHQFDGTTGPDMYWGETVTCDGVYVDGVEYYSNYIEVWYSPRTVLYTFHFGW